MFKYIHTFTINLSNSLLLATEGESPEIWLYLSSWSCSGYCDMLPRSPSMAKGLIPAAAGTTDDQQLNWIMIQDLPLVERSHFIQAQMFFLGQPTYNEWLMKVGQSSGPWPQLGISLKGHSSSRTPCRNDWSVYCNCITVQPLHLVNSASFTIPLLPPN